MIWIYAEDSYYYENIDKLKKYLQKKHSHIAEKIKNESDLEIVFQKQDAVNLLRDRKFNKIILSPFKPSTLELNSSFFGIINVQNFHGILTTDEKQAGFTEYEKLNNSLGLIVEESSLSFADMGGGEELVNIVRQLDTKYAFGETPKAVFLAGIMGTGKSFFAQCLAGETKRLLVSFNLAKIMNFDNPIEAFDNIVKYLVEQNGKYLLWIDEIEKMFNGSEASEHIKNKFLTFLNDIGVTIPLDAYVVITANDVSDILSKNPEMVRGGRVEPFAKVFLNFLTNDSANNIARLYLGKRNEQKNHLKYIANNILAFRENRLPEGVFLEKYLIRKAEIIENKFSEDVETKPIDTAVKLVSEIFEEDEINEISERLSIKVEPEYIVDYIDRVYKDIHRSSTLLNFPYVPAEIKEIISQIFYVHVIQEVTQKNVNDVIEKIVKSNIAIGDAGKAGISKMLGNKDKFSIIIE
jgi:SpoVK/Ycf46/Vps4 family AAA+-type ATPase